MVSEGIGLCSKASRAEVDGEVELEEVLQPVGLTAALELEKYSRFLWLVTTDHIDQRGRTLEVVSPVLEGLEDGQELLVMGIIVQLRGGQSLRIVSNRSELRISTNNGQNAGNGIVQGIGLDHKRSVGNPMNENQSGREGLL